MRLLNRLIINIRRFFRDGNCAPNIVVSGGVLLVRKGRRKLLSVRLEQLKAFGEATDWPDLWMQDCFLVLEQEAPEGVKTIRVSNDCRGWNKAVVRLRTIYAVPDSVKSLANCVHPASVYLWPPEKAGQPIWPDYGPSRSVGTKEDFERWMKERK